MQVTIVAHDIGDVGGMERMLTQLILGLLEAGHELTVISRTCGVSTARGLQWVRVPGPARPLPLAYPWFLLLGSLITRRRRQGIVLTTGAIVLNRVDWSTVHLCHHAARDLGVSRMSRATLAYRLNARIARLVSRLGERLCYRPSRIGGLVGVSQGVSSELKKYFPDMNVITIANGVNVERFKPSSERRRETRERHGVGTGELLAVFVGSEWSGKGLEFAIRALAVAPGWKLLVVGAGDEAWYRSLAARAGVADRVIFAGVTSDPGPLYCGGDAFVLPSIYETFSLVTYEAAASGLPLLATPVSGVTDILVDGVNGWFIERDARDIGRKLSALGDDPDLRQQMGETGRRAAGQFTWERTVLAYRRLIDEGRVPATRTGSLKTLMTRMVHAHRSSSF